MASEASEAANIDEREREMCEEVYVLAHLQAVEKKYGDDRNILALVRAYRRKNLEAHDLKGYLSGVRQYFESCWDEEDEHFDPNSADRADGAFVPGHWCPNLIEEIGEMTEDGVVYSPMPLGDVA